MKNTLIISLIIIVLLGLLFMLKKHTNGTKELATLQALLSQPFQPQWQATT